MTNLETRKLIDLAQTQKSTLRLYVKLVDILSNIANSDIGVHLENVLMSSECDVHLTSDLARQLDELDYASNKLDEAISKSSDGSYSPGEVTDQVLADAINDAADIISECQSKLRSAESCLKTLTPQIMNASKKFSQSVANAEYYKNDAATIASGIG